MKPFLSEIFINQYFISGALPLPKSMEQRKQSLIVLFLINFCGNSGYSIVIPLYPPLAISKGLNESTVGYIFCVYPVGAFVVSLILGQLMTNQTMKKLMLLGLIMTTSGMLGLALVENIDDEIYFIYTSALMRLITGIGATLCFTPSYSLAAYLFPDNLTQVLSQMEIVSGLAMFSGPLVGGLFQIIGEYTPIGGYKLPYYVLCLIYVMTIPLLINVLQVEREVKQISIELQPFFIHEQTLDTESVNDKQQLKTNLIDYPKLSYQFIFRIRGIVISYLSFVFLFVFSMALRTYLAIYLQEEYNLNNSQSTLVFLCDTLTFGISAYLVGNQHTFDKKLIFALSLLISSIAFFMHGPDTMMTGLPHKLWIVILADGLYGLGMGAICALIIAEFVNIIQEEYPNKVNEQNVNDIASALYISGWSFGEFAGPLIGSVIIPKYGFPMAGSIMGIGMFLVFLVYSEYAIKCRRSKQLFDPIQERLI